MPIVSSPRLTAIVVVALAYAPSAHALTVSSTGCVVQAGNVLRYDCPITTDGAAEVWLEFCEGATCSTYNMASPKKTLASADTVPVTMFGIKSNTTYRWRAAAKQGGVTVRTLPPVNITTGSLPFEVDDLTISTWGTAAQISNVTFNFACADGGVADQDWIVTADKSGNVIWYEEPALTLGVNTLVKGLNVARPSKDVLAIYGLEYLVQVDRDGTVERLYCRDAGGGDCGEAAVPKDGVFADYVHHDLFRLPGSPLLYALTAETEYVSNDDNCPPYGANHPIVIDGVIVINTSTDAVVAEWQTSDFYSPGYGDATCPTAPGSCSNGYFGALVPGCDWSHSNSIWVDAGLQWTISHKKWNRLISVDGDSGSTTYLDVDWELEGDGLGGDFALFSTPSYTDTFNDQHAAMWTGDDTTMVFDNHSGAGDPRGIEIDWSTGDADIINEYVMEDSTGGPLDCSTGGTVQSIQPGGNVVTFCVDDDGTATTVDPTFNEFDGSNNLVWGMKVTCGTAGARDSAPSYRGYPNVL